MKKIEGNEKEICTELHKQIYKVLSDKMPDDVTDRYVSFEWCKSGKYTGQCILRSNFPVAVVRISSMFDFDRNTIAHEVLHALLPFNTKHGPLFKKAMAIINDVLNLHVTIVATKALSQTCKKPDTHYKYAIVNKQTGELLMRFKRYCKKITACLYYEANDPDWGYTVIPYDEYLKQHSKHTTEKVACAVNNGQADDEQPEKAKKDNGIIVKTENVERIAKTLNVANGKGRERLACIGDVFDSVDILAEKFKDINKENLKVEVNVHAQKFARCYKGVPMATTFVLLFKRGKWRLLSANRVPCGTVRFRVLHMEPETRYSILRKFETF